MKLKLIYLSLLVISMLVISCKNSKNQNVNKVNVTEGIITDTFNLNIPDTLLSTDFRNNEKFDSVSHHTVIRFDPIKMDTILGNFHILCIEQDNEDLIVRNPITGGKGLDTVYYVDREVVLKLQFKGKEILNKKIIKTDFSSYISKEEMQQQSISYCRIERVESEEIIFSISLCMPETDVCYWFQMHVNRKGEIKIVEEEVEEDENY